MTIFISQFVNRLEVPRADTLYVIRKTQPYPKYQKSISLVHRTTGPRACVQAISRYFLNDYTYLSYAIC